MARNLGVREGDLVELYCQSTSWIYGVVLHTPADTGDSWIIETVDDKEIYHFLNFDYIKLIERKKDLK